MSQKLSIYIFPCTLSTAVYTHSCWGWGVSAQTEQHKICSLRSGSLWVIWLIHLMNTCWARIRFKFHAWVLTVSPFTQILAFVFLFALFFTPAFITLKQFVIWGVAFVLLAEFSTELELPKNKVKKTEKKQASKS